MGTFTPNGTKQNLATRWSTLGAWIALGNGSPGTTGAGEVTTSPRVQTTWTPGTDGKVTSAQTTHAVKAGKYTHALVFSAETGGTFIDAAPITEQNPTGDGQILVTLTYTQS